MQAEFEIRLRVQSGDDGALSKLGNMVLRSNVDARDAALECNQFNGLFRFEYSIVISGMKLNSSSTLIKNKSLFLNKEKEIKSFCFCCVDYCGVCSSHNYYSELLSNLFIYSKIRVIFSVFVLFFSL